MVRRMKHDLYTYDLPDNLDFEGESIAVDCEAMGLKQPRDRLCVVQLSDGSGRAQLVHFPDAIYDRSPNLCRLLADPKIEKIFHFGRFDVGLLKQYLAIDVLPLYCTRTASRLARTYTDKHGLKDICRELLGIDISKQQQTSYWGCDTLTPEQVEYAATDVLHLHKLKDILSERLEKEGRLQLALAIMQGIYPRAMLDIAGWPDEDIYAHS